MIPNRITFHFCYDNKNLPPTNMPVLCIFPEALPNGTNVGDFCYCTLLQSIDSTGDKFWVKHNSLEKTRVYPYAWLGFPNGLPDVEFMDALRKEKTLEFLLQDPPVEYNVAYPC